ncbi:hypothetical protein GCM10022254_32270 [Actinomadura meridiana]|uniref:Uncharacterized protein n=1 Tax=Actinomadura meridiana TaxID=559626 RepID=A0ABP8C275_9ACTN
MASDAGTAVVHGSPAAWPENQAIVRPNPSLAGTRGLQSSKESMIGVYKRCVRVGTALAERGHEVLLAPHGMKLPAEEPPGITFVELPFTPPQDKDDCFGLAEEGPNRLRDSSRRERQWASRRMGARPGSRCPS